MQTVLIGQSFSIIKRYDYGLESGLIMRKGFLDQSPDKKYEVSKLRILTKNVFLLSVVLSY